MKCNAFVTKFTFILLLKIINGQRKGLAYNENYETHRPALQQSTHTMVNNVNQLENIAPLPHSTNQNQMLTHTNTPLLSPTTLEIQLPPDLQQQPLQVQQYLKLEQPISIHQPLQPQTKMQVHPSLQPQQPLQLQLQGQVKPISQSQQITQDNLQFKPQVLQLQQPMSQQLLQTPLPLRIQQKVQPQEFLQLPQPMHIQQPQKGFVQKSLTIPESNMLVDTPINLEGNNNPRNSKIQVKWMSSNPQVVTNVDKPHHIPNQNVQVQDNSLNKPIDITPNAQKVSYKLQEVPYAKYYVASQQPISPSPSRIAASAVSNSQPLVKTPTNYITPAEETYVSFIQPYNYVTPTSELLISVPEGTKSFDFIPSSPTVLTIPTSPIQNTNKQSHYYNPQAPDATQNVYINQNSGFGYPKQSKFLDSTLKSQPITFVPSQSSASSSTPISIIQTPSVSQQYGVLSGYPVNAVVAPAYISQSSKPSNLKSFLPLIFNLLREKIASCSYKSNCPCECKSNSTKNEVEVSSGYSNQNHYGPLNNGFSVFNSVCGDEQGSECLRERKNSEKIETISEELSNETLEEEESDEEELEEDEDD